MATDEILICLHSTKKYTCQRPGGRKVVRNVKHPLRIHVWGCLAKQGFGRVLFQEQLGTHQTQPVWV